MNLSTPPMASRSRSSSSSSSETDFDDDYFFKTYVPLSNLPTPPSTSSRQTTPELFASEEHLDSDLLGPAIHLKNLLPPSLSLTPPSVPVVHALLTRAGLPREVIALAVCILDSLPSRFALAFRASCPLNTPLSALQTTHPSTTSNPTILFQSHKTSSVQAPHKDALHPELLILASLILAQKFTDDTQETTSTYRDEWALGMWSNEQINFSQRCIMEALEWRLLGLWRREVIEDAIRDMERCQFAARSASEHTHEKLMYPPEPQVWDADWDEETLGHESKMDGKAMVGVGGPLTPAETPLVENVRGTRDVLPQTRRAFEDLEGRGLPGRSMEPFPRYVDPAV